MFCTNCGEEISDDSKFCRKCGTPIEPLDNEISEEEYENHYNDTEMDNTSEIERTPRQRRTYNKTKKSNLNDSLLLIIIGMGIGFLFLFFVQNTGHSNYIPENSDLDLDNDVHNNSYGDSDEDSDVDLESVYSEVLSQDSSYSNYMKLASDKSYIEIDTNPNDMHYSNSETAHELIRIMDRKLGFSESLENKMSKTTGGDGIQSEKSNNIEVTWSYSPLYGLEVQYTKLK